MVLRGGGLSLLSREPAPGFSAFPAGVVGGQVFILKIIFSGSFDSDF